MKKYLISENVFTRKINSSYYMWHSINGKILKINKELFDYINENEDIESNDILEKYGFIFEQNKTRSLNHKQKIHEIHLMMTSSCNFACTYCSVEKTKKQNFNHINLNINNVINFFKEIVNANLNNSKRKLRIRFFGGKPLLNFLTIKKTVEFLRDYDEINELFELNYIVNTNASLLTDEICDFFAMNNFTIMVSLDGATYAQNRNRIDKQGKSTIECVKDKLNLLADNNCKFTILVVFSIENLNEIDSLITLCKRYGLKSIGFQHVRFVNEDLSIQYYKDYVKKYLEYIKRFKENGILVAGHLDNLLNYLFVDNSTFFKERKSAGCGGYGATICLKADGKISNCHTDQNNGFKSVKEFYNSDYFKKSQSEYLEKEFCVGCEIEGICSGQCREEFYSKYSKNNICMFHEEIFNEILIMLEKDNIVKYFNFNSNSHQVF